MLTLYVICFVGGGLWIALWILGVGGLDTNFGASARFRQLRRAVCGMAFFGLIGALFTILGVGWLLTLVFALAWAVVAASTDPRLSGWVARGDTTRMTPRPIEHVDGPRERRHR